MTDDFELDLPEGPVRDPNDPPEFPEKDGEHPDLDAEDDVG